MRKAIQSASTMLAMTLAALSGGTTSANATMSVLRLYLPPAVLAPSTAVQKARVVDGHADVAASRLKTAYDSARYGGKSKRSLNSSISAAGGPRYSVENACKGIEIGDYDNCVEQEEAARAKVTSDWKSHSVTEREDCTYQSDLFSQSYVEIMICFEIQKWLKSPDLLSGDFGLAAGLIASAPKQPAKGLPESVSGRQF